MPALARQLRWYIALRLVAIGSVVLLFFLLQIVESQAPPEVPPAGVGSSTIDAVVETSAAVLEPARALYGLAALTFAATLLYIGLLNWLPRYYQAQAYVQFFGDLLLVTALVYQVGGLSSPFTLLYLIVIAVAATLLRKRAGLLVASVAYLLYAGLALALRYEWIGQPPLGEGDLGFSRLAYNLAVHLIGFYAVALLTSYLAHNIARAELELEAKTEDLADLQVVHRDVIESISSGLLTTDLEGTITSANRAGADILRSTEARLAGASVWSTGLFTEEGWAAAAAQSRERGKLRSEVEITTEEQRLYVGFTISNLVDAEGVQRGYILIFQDLTRWNRLQEEMRVKDRMAAVGELAAGLAHEIGNPLAAITGSVQMLSSSLPTDSSQRRLLDILWKESQRLDRTIKGFLRFARPRELAVASFDVARMLSENFELLKNSAEVSPRHALEIDLNPSSAMLVADPDQLSQIFWNLARNALRAMPDGGRLAISGRIESGCYVLRVLDSGRGMSEEQRANLFHPFQSFFDGGTGIGMAIVYRIVQEHGGQLHVDSRPNVGTTITVELPISAPHGPTTDELATVEGVG